MYESLGLLTVPYSASSVSNEEEYPLSHLSLSACAEKLPPVLLRRSRDSSSFCSSVSSAVYTPVSLVGSGPSSRKASRPGSATQSVSPLKRTPSPTKRSGCYSPLVPLSLTPCNGSIATRIGTGSGAGKRHSSPRSEIIYLSSIFFNFVKFMKYDCRKILFDYDNCIACSECIVNNHHFSCFSSQK